MEFPQFPFNYQLPNKESVNYFTLHDEVVWTNEINTQINFENKPASFFEFNNSNNSQIYGGISL